MTEYLSCENYPTSSSQFRETLYSTLFLVSPAFVFFPELLETIRQFWPSLSPVGVLDGLARRVYRACQFA